MKQIDEAIVSSHFDRGIVNMSVTVPAIGCFSRPGLLNSSASSGPRRAPHFAAPVGPKPPHGRFGRAILTAACSLLIACPAPAQCHPRESTQLFAPDGAPSDFFGYFVAIDGDTVLVGAPSDDTTAADAGSVHVFVRDSGVWMHQAQLFASDAAANDNFGFPVALSADTAVIGAFLDNTSAGADAGSVYVFERAGDVWTQRAHLFASDAAPGDQFGRSIAINGDTLIVTADRDDTAAGVDAGSAYVFGREDGVWGQQARLFAANGAAFDWFGSSVALNGGTVIVGAEKDDTSGGSDAGSVHVFTRNAAVWSHQAQLFALDGAAGDRFGDAVALDSDFAVVGAYSDETVGGVYAGSAYVFVRADGVWEQQAQLFATDGAAGDYFGDAVAIRGEKVVVGATLDDTAGGTDAGSAYVFVRSAGIWAQQDHIIASNSASEDALGQSLAIAGDTLIAGAFHDTTVAGTGAGSVYVFDLEAPQISQEPLSQRVCNQGLATFTVAADGNATYQWYRDRLALVDGGNISGASSATLVVEPAQPADEGCYLAEVSNECGSTFSATAVLQVAHLTPPFIENWISTEFDPAKWTEWTASIDELGPGEPSPPYSMHLEADEYADSAGADLSTYTLVALRYWWARTATETGDDFSVYFRDESESLVLLDSVPAGSNSTSFAFREVMLPPEALHCKFQLRFTAEADAVNDEWYIDNIELVCLPPTIVNQPSDATSPPGGAAVFTVSSNDIGAVYQWRKDETNLLDGPTVFGSVIAGATTPVLTISNAQPADSGSYNAIVGNACGAVQSESAALTVVECSGDLDGDGTVGVSDLLTLLQHFGLPAGVTYGHGDVDLDGDVDLADLSSLLSGYGRDCP